MRRGVKARLTSFRSFVWSGGSIMISNGKPTCSSLIMSRTIPWLDTNVSLSSSPLRTSS